MPEVQAKLREARDRLSEADYLVGYFYYRQQKWYPGAIDRFKSVLKDDPGFTGRDAVYFYLADSLMKVQREAEALPYLEKLVAEFEKSEYLVLAQKKIAELKAPLPRHRSNHQEVSVRRQCSVIVVTAIVSALAAAGVASAQTAAPLTQLEQAIACAPPTVSADLDASCTFSARRTRWTATSTAPAICWSSTAAPPPVSSSASSFFVRRANVFGGTPDGTAVTAGWISVVAVNDSTAIASIDHLCGTNPPARLSRAFVPPVAPAGADHADDAGDPDFGAMGHDPRRQRAPTIVGAGDFALIDRGTEQGVEAGSRFAVYRTSVRACRSAVSARRSWFRRAATIALARITRRATRSSSATTSSLASSQPARRSVFRSACGSRSVRKSATRGLRMWLKRRK